MTSQTMKTTSMNCKQKERKIDLIISSMLLHVLSIMCFLVVFVILWSCGLVVFVIVCLQELSKPS